VWGCASLFRLTGARSPRRERSWFRKDGSTDSSSAVSIELQALDIRCLIDGLPICLMRREAKLFEVLLAASGKVVTWSDLRLQVWRSLHVSEH
jgi:DNA-binding response OmpR family regulator